MPEADRVAFHGINGLAGHWAPLDWAMSGLANDYFIPLVLALALLGLWFSPLKNRERRQRGIMGAFLALLLVNLAIELLNLFYFRPRPFSQMEVNLLFYRPTDSSFPSNSATIGFAIAASLFLVERRLGLLLAFPAAVMALARVYVGVHFPSDVLGGAILGMAGACLSRLLLLWLKPIPRFILKWGRKFYLA